VDEFLDSLLPPDPNWQATGAIFRPQDERDHLLERLPEIVEARAAGLPRSFSRAEQMRIVYNQGSIPKCVSSSACTVKTMQEVGDIGRTLAYDDDELYRAAGGNGTNGVPTTTVMNLARSPGILVRGTQKRYQYASFAFAPQVAQEFRQIIAAAIMTNGPVQIAVLLPSSFGWDSNTSPTRAYHAVAGIGWDGLDDDGWLEIGNSWGSEWGQGGRGRLKWGYIEGGNFLNRYNYGVQILDFRDGSVVPPPPPPPPPPADKAAAVAKLVNQARSAQGLAPLAIDPVLMQAAQGHSANMAGANFYSHVSPDGKGPRERLTAAGVGNVAWAENIAAGMSDPNAAFSAWMNSPPHRANTLNPAMTRLGAGFAEGPGRYRYYWTELFTGGGGVTPPPPDRLSITLVQSGRQDVLVSQGGPLSVTGTGFAGGQVAASIAGVVCAVEPRSATSLVVRAPLIGVSGELRLTRGADQVTGPRIVVA
jgi:hypothetical protein